MQFQQAKSLVWLLYLEESFEGFASHERVESAVIETECAENIGQRSEAFLDSQFVHEGGQHQWGRYPKMEEKKNNLEKVITEIHNLKPRCSHNWTIRTCTTILSCNVSLVTLIQHGFFHQHPPTCDILLECSTKSVRCLTTWDLFINITSSVPKKKSHVI